MQGFLMILERLREASGLICFKTMASGSKENLR